MVKFGHSLDELKRSDWSDGYVSYKELKTLLKNMDAAGTTREFSEHTVYKALSVASASNLLQPNAPRETDFFGAIDKEIDKVNAFSDSLRRQLVDQFEKARKKPTAQAAHECTEALQRFAVATPPAVHLPWLSRKVQWCRATSSSEYSPPPWSFARQWLTEHCMSTSGAVARMPAPLALLPPTT